MINRRSRSDKVVDSMFYVLLTIFTLMLFYPFYYLFINSFNGNLMYGKAYFLPIKWTLGSYKLIFSDTTLLNAFFVSFMRTILGTAACVFNCAMCAYALRRERLHGRGFYLILFTIPMFFSGGLIPTFLNIKRLGLYDNFLVYLLPGLFSFFFVIILMTNFNEIPKSLEESAHIDGANHFIIFIRIFLPVSLPVIATLALFAGVTQWNSWFDTLFFTRSKKLETLAAVLLKIVRQQRLDKYAAEFLKDASKQSVNPEGVKLATMIVSIVPVLLVFPLMQKYFIKGVRIGAVKG